MINEVDADGKLSNMNDVGQLIQFAADLLFIMMTDLEVNNHHGYNLKWSTNTEAWTRHM